MRRLFLFLALSGAARAEMTPQRAAEDFQARQPLAEAPAVADLKAARAWRDLLVHRLEKQLGPPAGYKAGLTNPQVQKRFGVREPVMGVLLQKMFMTNGTEIASGHAARPVIEADLLVRVGDEAINEARTDLELLRSLDVVIPFIELPDLVCATNVAMDGLALTALNAGARAGVAGKEIPLSTATDWPQRFAFFHVELSGRDGQRVAEGGGGALLGHPLKSVRWLRDDLLSQGRRLKKGDVLSLGSLTPMLALEAGQDYTATYYNLDPAGPTRVQVRVRANSR